MNIKARLEKLERKKAMATPRVCILVTEGASREEALRQWQVDHPGKPVPHDPFIITLVPFSQP